MAAAVKVRINTMQEFILDFSASASAIPRIIGYLVTNKSQVRFNQRPAEERSRAIDVVMHLIFS